nr:ribosomal protein S8 [uncultured bacterium]
MITDPIADFLTRIRNASRARHDFVMIPYSKMKEQLANLLSSEGFLGEVKIVRNEKFPQIKIYLISGNEQLQLNRKSSPGLRRYVSAEELRPVKQGFGVGVISTSKGIVTIEQAKALGVGGEYICEVY